MIDKIGKPNEVVAIRIISAHYGSATIEVRLRGEKYWHYYPEIRLNNGDTLYMTDGNDEDVEFRHGVIKTERVADEQPSP